MDVNFFSLHVILYTGHSEILFHYTEDGARWFRQLVLVPAYL